MEMESVAMQFEKLKKHLEKDEQIETRNLQLEIDGLRIINGGKILFECGRMVIPLSKSAGRGLLESSMKELALHASIEGVKEIKRELKKTREIKFVDLKKKYLKEEKKEEKEKKEEEKKKKEEKKKLPLFPIGKKEERRSLEEDALYNLEQCKLIDDERKRIIMAANVIKEFLEVKFKIREELTYAELIERMDVLQLPSELKTELKNFFEKMIFYEYAKIGNMSFDYAYNLGLEVIKGK